MSAMWRSSERPTHALMITNTVTVNSDRMIDHSVRAASPCLVEVTEIESRKVISASSQPSRCIATKNQKNSVARTSQARSRPLRPTDRRSRNATPRIATRAPNSCSSRLGKRGSRLVAASSARPVASTASAVR